MSVLVYTQVFGGRDDVRPQAPQTYPGIDWLYITDGEAAAPPPWRTLPFAEWKHPHPNMAAKWWRTHPPFDGISPELTPLAPYDYCIHIDANMQITNPGMVASAIGSLSDGFAVWEHPRRDCVYDEIEASLGDEGQEGRYFALPLREQGEAYRAEGFPERGGLYATGSIVWTRERAADVGEAWWSECEKWGFQDQVSFPVVCWRLGVKPGLFPVHQTMGRYNRRQGWWANHWMVLHDHRKGTG